MQDRQGIAGEHRIPDEPDRRRCRHAEHCQAEPPQLVLVVEPAVDGKPGDDPGLRSQETGDDQDRDAHPAVGGRERPGHQRGRDGVDEAEGEDAGDVRTEDEGQSSGPAGQDTADPLARNEEQAGRQAERERGHDAEGALGREDSGHGADDGAERLRRRQREVVAKALDAHQ